MYFECKGCGSRSYKIENGQIICAHCGAGYIKEDKKIEKKTIFLILLALILLISTALILKQDKESNDTKPSISTKDKNYIQIDNTNAQIGSQIININSSIIPQESNPNPIKKN